MRAIIYSTILISLLSCGQSDDDKINKAIFDAHVYLSSRNCSKAKEVLLSVGKKPTYAPWVQAYASSFACSGSFDEPTFFGNDLSKLNAAKDAMVGSITTFSSSTINPTTAEFSNLQDAIELLLYAGGEISSSSNANRKAIYGASDTSNIDTQALYMIIVQMGRWFKYYGNTSDQGIKGNGTGPNTCLMTYTDAGVIAGLDLVPTGSCTSAANLGHTAIIASPEPKICEAIVLYNNFIDIISNISFAGGNTGSLGSLAENFKTLCTTLGIGDLCSIKDQAPCEAETLVDIEIFSASLFETIFQ